MIFLSFFHKKYEIIALNPHQMTKNSLLSFKVHVCLFAIHGVNLSTGVPLYRSFQLNTEPPRCLHPAHAANSVSRGNLCIMVRCYPHSCRKEVFNACNSQCPIWYSAGSAIFDLKTGVRVMESMDHYFVVENAPVKPSESLRDSFFARRIWSGLPL